MFLNQSFVFLWIIAVVYCESQVVPAVHLPSRPRSPPQVAPTSRNPRQVAPTSRSSSQVAPSSRSQPKIASNVVVAPLEWEIPGPNDDVKSTEHIKNPFVKPRICQDERPDCDWYLAHDMCDRVYSLTYVCRLSCGFCNTNNGIQQLTQTDVPGTGGEIAEQDRAREIVSQREVQNSFAEDIQSTTDISNPDKSQNAVARDSHTPKGRGNQNYNQNSNEEHWQTTARIANQREAQNSFNGEKKEIADRGNQRSVKDIFGGVRPASAGRGNQRNAQNSIAEVWQTTERRANQGEVQNSFPEDTKSTSNRSEWNIASKEKSIEIGEWVAPSARGPPAARPLDYEEIQANEDEAQQWQKPTRQWIGSNEKEEQQTRKTQRPQETRQRQVSTHRQRLNKESRPTSRTPGPSAQIQNSAALQPRLPQRQTSPQNSAGAFPNRPNDAILFNQNSSPVVPPSTYNSNIGNIQEQPANFFGPNQNDENYQQSADVYAEYYAKAVGPVYKPSPNPLDHRFGNPHPAGLPQGYLVVDPSASGQQETGVYPSQYLNPSNPTSPLQSLFTNSRFGSPSLNHQSQHLRGISYNPLESPYPTSLTPGGIYPRPGVYRGQPTRADYHAQRLSHYLQTARLLSELLAGPTPDPVAFGQQQHLPSSIARFTQHPLNQVQTENKLLDAYQLQQRLDQLQKQSAPVYGTIAPPNQLPEPPSSGDHSESTEEAANSNFDLPYPHTQKQGTAPQNSAPLSGSFGLWQNLSPQEIRAFWAQNSPPAPELYSRGEESDTESTAPISLDPILSQLSIFNPNTFEATIAPPLDSLSLEERLETNIPPSSISLDKFDSRSVDYHDSRSLDLLEYSEDYLEEPFLREPSLASPPAFSTPLSSEVQNTNGPELIPKIEESVQQLRRLFPSLFDTEQASNLIKKDVRPKDASSISKSQGRRNRIGLSSAIRLDSRETSTIEPFQSTSPSKENVVESFVKTQKNSQKGVFSTKTSKRRQNEIVNSFVLPKVPALYPEHVPLEFYRRENAQGTKARSNSSSRDRKPKRLRRRKLKKQPVKANVAPSARFEVTEKPIITKNYTDIGLLEFETSADKFATCCIWASKGLCTTKRRWMKENCDKACSIKGCTTCIDEYPDCKRWAEFGICKLNPDYMHVMCRKSCKTC